MKVFKIAALTVIFFFFFHLAKVNDLKKMLLLKNSHLYTVYDSTIYLGTQCSPHLAVITEWVKEKNYN